VLPAPFVLGHESSGTIVELGSKANSKGLKIGDKCIFYFNLYCGKCHYCRNGQENLCSNVQAGVYGMAEYAVVNEQQVHKVPEAMPLEEACLVEPVSVCLRGVDLANIKPGNSAAISGGGTIGLITLELAILAGATMVTLIEPIEEKRKLALGLGADFVLDPNTQDVGTEALKITESRGFDAVFECSGSRAATQPAFGILGRGGTLVLVAIYGTDYNFPINTDQLFYKEATIRGCHQSPYMFPRTIALMNKMNLKPFTTAIFPLEEALKAYGIHKTGKFPKVIIKF